MQEHNLTEEQIDEFRAKLSSGMVKCCSPLGYVVTLAGMWSCWDRMLDDSMTDKWVSLFFWEFWVG